MAWIHASNNNNNNNKAKRKELTHVNLCVSIILFFLFRYRNGRFITRRGTAIEETPVIYDKNKHNNEIYGRCETRYESFQKIRVVDFVLVLNI